MSTKNLKVKQITQGIAEKFGNDKAKGLKEARLSVFALVRNIREQRYGGVQIDKQYEMIYKYYKELCKEFFE